MLLKSQNNELNLTAYILEQYWLKNPEPLLKYIDDDILWIGSTDAEYIHGKQNMQERLFKNITESPLVYLDEQEYEIAGQDTNSCLVVGRYRAYTKPESGIVLSEKQRITFYWFKKADKLCIKHIHLSNILHIQDDDEYFPTKAGKQSYEYMKSLVAKYSNELKITICDHNSVIKLIPACNIIYIKADHNYINIHLIYKTTPLHIRDNISSFYKKLPDNFIFISRSIIVNKDYIKSIYMQQITLQNNTKIKIPAARYKDIINLLRKE